MVNIAEVTILRFRFSVDEFCIRAHLLHVSLIQRVFSRYGSIAEADFLSLRSFDENEINLI